MDALKQYHCAGFIVDHFWSEFGIVMYMSLYYKCSFNATLEINVDGHVSFKEWRL